MRLERDTLVLRETGEFFHLELSGQKPNTTFGVSPPLNRDLMRARPLLRRVRVYNENQVEFEREISDLTCVGVLLGSFFWTVPWVHDDSPAVKGRRSED